MRKGFSAEFKAQVAIEAIRNDSTIAELSKKYDVHPSQIQVWKAELLSQAETIFSRGHKAVESNEKYIEALERKAGQLAIEVDFLKKNLKTSPGKNGSK